MILTFQSSELRKHSPVGLNDLLPTQPLLSLPAKAGLGWSTPLALTSSTLQGGVVDEQLTSDNVTVHES